MFGTLPVEVSLDAFGWLHRLELDSCRVVTRQWKDFIDAHGDDFPIHHFRTFELELDHHKEMRLEREPLPEGLRKASLTDLKCRSDCLDGLKNVDLTSFTAACPENDGNDPEHFVNLRITYNAQNNESVEVAFRCSSVVADAPENALEVLHWFSHSASAFYDWMTFHRMVNLDAWELALPTDALVHCGTFCFSGGISTPQLLQRAVQFLHNRVRSVNFEWYTWNLWDVGHEAEETVGTFFDVVLNSSDSVEEQLVLVGWVIGEGVIDRLIKRFLAEELRPVPRIFIDLPISNGHTIPQPAACNEGARMKDFPSRITSDVQEPATRTCYTFKKASGSALDVAIGSHILANGTSEIQTVELYFT